MNNKKDSNSLLGKFIAFSLVFLSIGLIIYFGYPFYVKSKAKHDLEKIGITFSEQKFIDKACDGDDGSVALFIEAGMNINVLAVPSTNDRTTKSALHCAASTGNLTLAKTLLNLGADVNIKDDNSNTPLFSASGAVRYNNKRNEIPNNLELVKLLVEKGGDVNAGGVAGTPLIAAVQARSFEVLDYLLEKGASAKVKNKEGMTPLMLLAYSYNNKNKEVSEKITALIKAGARVNDSNNNGQTALMIAVNNRSSEMVRLLLENGADPGIEDKNGSNILSYALSDPATLKLFLDKGANPNVTVNGEPLLHQAIYRNDATFQILLANKNTDLNIKNRNGDNILHVLARSPNYAQKINLLVANSVAINAPNNLLETPLIKAVQSHNMAAVTILIDSKANINARDAAGRTALYYANQYIVRNGYERNYGASLPAAALEAAQMPAPMAPSQEMDIREIMRTNNKEALQRYVAAMQSRNRGSTFQNSKSQFQIANKDPLVELLQKHGAIL